MPSDEQGLVVHSSSTVMPTYHTPIIQKTDSLRTNSLNFQPKTSAFRKKKREGRIKKKIHKNTWPPFNSDTVTAPGISGCYCTSAPNTMPFRTSKKSRHRRNPTQHAVCSEGETRQGYLSVRDAAGERERRRNRGRFLAYMRRQAPTRSTEIVRGLYSHAVHGSYSSVAAAAPPPSVVVAGCGGALLSSPCRARGCCLASIAPNQETPAGLARRRGMQAAKEIDRSPRTPADYRAPTESADTDCTLNNNKKK
jgi:hypothetical protein